MAGSNFYLGNVSDLASNMGSMFGGSGTQGMSGLPPLKPPIKGGPQEGPTPSPQPQQPVTGSGSAYPGTFNPLAAQAVRPTSFGKFDPQYGQNLATFVGQSFQRPQQNQALQFNPYGNLTDANVQYPNLGMGNAPLPGLPQTLLQWAQFFNPTALTPPALPVLPDNGGDNTGRSGGGRNRD